MDCRTQLASLANEEEEKGDFLMATKILTTSIRLDPNNHELYFERSICHYKLGLYQASLNDADSAIRINSADCKYNQTVHYQKGLAWIGLGNINEALSSFKKAIELCAKRDDSKLSHIFIILRDATNELKTARKNQPRGESVPMPDNQASTVLSHGQGTSNEPVDSTTDRPTLHQPGTSANHQKTTSIESLIKTGNNNLVAPIIRNNQPITNSNQAMSGGVGINRVSSSASHINNHHMSNNSSINVDARGLEMDLLRNQSNQNADQPKTAAQLIEWNIRRSERIFLHHSNEPGSSGPQYGILTRHIEPPGVIVQRQRTGSNPSSINSGSRGATKRPHDSNDSQTYQQNKSIRSKDGTNSHAESDVDVDDSNNQQLTASPNPNDIINNHKRVLVTPSSSMPATSQGPSTSTSKDDSYSSKYKRLRRDRERARRGTSKLCTIRPSDLEELHRAANTDLNKRLMRVIAPIDGWLYSGQLSVDDSSASNGIPQYVVKLDGDATGSSYLFNSDTVLNDVIKEVRVKSVSELRKGARICCYWSRQYKCLSTGVVTSRTFEATKSLVSVKYDNGDLSALPLEDLRLLPPDYPKYMSNCDPLLLARNGDGAHVTATMSNNNMNQNGNRIIVECKPQPISDVQAPNGGVISNESVGSEKNDVSLAEKSRATVDNTKPLLAVKIIESQERFLNDEKEERDSIDEIQPELAIDEENKERLVQDDNEDEAEDEEDDDGDATIPPTDETIDFITSESTLKQHDHIDRAERVSITKDNITIINETQLGTITSRASSEENNYGIEYRPWIFDGPPRRSKRHGRTYRDNYSMVRRGDEVIRVGDSAELMPRDESILPFIAKIDGFWATGRGEMRVRVRWYYRLGETEGVPYELRDGDNALFETDHFDENDVQSIYRATKILSWSDYSRNNLGHVNKNNDNTPKIFYLAGYYDPVRRVKHLKSDVKEAQ